MEGTTESFKLETTKLNLNEAKASIAGYARAYGTEVVEVTEEHKRFSIELTVTVRGEPDGIDSMRSAMGGDGFSGSGGGPVDWVLNAGLGAVSKSIQKSRWRRKRAEPAD